MKVVRLHGAGQLRLHDEPVPEPASGEVLIQVRAVGICGSDLHWYQEECIGDAALTHPLVLGHEFSGMISEGPRKGERVAVDPEVACLGCYHCLAGNPNLCVNQRFAGHGSQDGALQEFITWPTRCLHPIPDTFSDIDGAMLEPLGVALHALDLGHVRAGCSVGVFGCGPIGLLLLQLARVAGVTQLLATDRLPHRLEAAMRLGADAAFLAEDGGEAEEVLRLTSGRGVDVAVELAGENPAVETTMACVRPGGQVVLVGIPEDDRTSFRASVARRKGLTIRLSRRMKHSFPRALRIALVHKLELEALVSHRFPLEQAGEAFEIASRRSGLKVVIEPGAIEE